MKTVGRLRKTMYRGVEKIAMQLDLHAVAYNLVRIADPYAAWQRGSNENINGILMFYYPKGTDFSKVSKQNLERVIRRINNRPRKCLNYRSPHQVMQELVGGALVT